MKGNFVSERIIDMQKFLVLIVHSFSYGGAQLCQPISSMACPRRGKPSTANWKRPPFFKVIAPLGKKAICAIAAFRFHRNPSILHN